MKTLTLTLRVPGLFRGIIALTVAKMIAAVAGLEVIEANLNQNNQQ